MSEFQLSLLIIGLIVVLGVYLCGFWQQWRYRRSVGGAFETASSDPSDQSRSSKAPVASAGLDDVDDPLVGLTVDLDSGTTSEICGLLNDATDYVATFLLKTPCTSEVLGNLWQRRFDFGKTVLACGLNTISSLWERLIPESEHTYRAFRLGLQLVDRTGSVSQSRLAAFCELLSEIARELQIEIKLPSVDEALKRAQELDRFCADVDQMIGINLLTNGDRKLFGTEVASAAGRLGMSLQPDGAFHLLDEYGATLCSLSASDGTTFQHHTLNQSRVDSLTLLLDIPRVIEPVSCFDTMVALGQEMSKLLGTTLVDDQRVALSDGALAQIRSRVAATEDLMLVGHITPGSAQALRLFS